jgi:uncharacterized protein YlxW (UPF0749 family)
MTGLFNILQERGSPRAFYKLEGDLTKSFSEAEKIRHEYTLTQKDLDKNQEELDSFNEENGQLLDESISIKQNYKNLQWRKYATVGVYALISLEEIKLFFEETVNIDVPLLPAVILGVCIAYLLLKLAISYKHYDNHREINNSFFSWWEKYSYIVPLLIIPFLSLYLIANNPGNPANYIWLFFLVFSFLLNIKAASYSSEYIQMGQAETKFKEQKQIQKRIGSTNKNIEGLQRKLQEIVNSIRRKATDFRREYESFTEETRPELSLHIPYRFVLNTRVYYYDVLPIPQLNITMPPQGSINAFCNWWDDATNNPQSYNRNNTIIEAENPLELSGDQENTNQPASPVSENTANVNDNPVQDIQDDNESFGKIVSDNEKFI